MSRRRRIATWVLLVAFVVVPLVEIYTLVQVGRVIGPWWTILLLVADSIVGAWLMKREGRAAWRALNEALRTGRMPARELADGALILVGGTLMLTPGFVSDLVAFVLILPLTRPLARRLLTRVIARRMLAGGPGGGFAAGFGPGFGPGYSSGPGQTYRPGPGQGPVVRGDVIDED